MRNPRHLALSITFGLAIILAASPSFAQDDPNLPLLEREIGRLAVLSGGTVGVAAIHMESGRAVYYNGNELFPMASTYKVPIAVQIFTMVDRGEVTLDRMIELEEGDLHPGSGTLSELFDDPGVILSLHNLLELMLLISDNSATDIVLREAGGSGAVTARMHELGITGITVSRPTIELIGNYIGIREIPPDGRLTPPEFRNLSSRVSSEERERAAEEFDTDPRDTSTPEAMAALLHRLWKGEILSEESTELLLDIMHRCMTGEERIKGLLPPWAQVFHKTGTIGGTTNDVGIIELPGDAGHVVIAIFVKESERDVERREFAIAHIARAIHDYFLFNPGSK